MIDYANRASARSRKFKKLASIEEIHAGAIIPSHDYSTYTIEVATASGFRWFEGAREIQRSDTQSEIPSSGWDGYDWDRFAETFSSWNCDDTSSKRDSSRYSPIIPTILTNNSESGSEIAPGTDEILNELKRPTSQKTLSESVLHAEILEFQDSQKSILCDLLILFVMNSLELRNHDLRMAVVIGAAIRKSLWTISLEKVPTLALKFLAAVLNHDSKTALNVELEVAKTIANRLMISLLPLNNNTEDLIKELQKRECYLNDYFLLKSDCYAAVALNTILASVLLGGDLAGLVDKIKNLNVKWFHQMLLRRVTSTSENILLKQLAKKLDEFAELLKS